MTITIDQLDERVRQAVYESFVQTGEPPDKPLLAAALAISAPELADSYERLAERRALVLDPDTRAIWMAIPFSAVPTPILVRSDAQRWWANCAWDGLGVLTMLARDGVVETTCAASGAPIHIPIMNGQPAPTDCVLHMAVPLAQWWDSIGNT